jgi:hypothetical protein
MQPNSSGPAHLSVGKLEASFVDPLQMPNDNFGDAVAQSGSTIIIGASGTQNDDGDDGAAYIYSKGPSGWSMTPSATLESPSGCSQCHFGNAVAISGDTAIVGAVGAGDNMYIGSAYIFVKGPSGWPSTPTITLENPAQDFYSFFGYAVAISGNTAIVGSFGAEQAYIYSKGTSGWPSKPSVTLKGLRASSYNEFGYSVSVSANTAIIGAPGTKTTKQFVGMSYIYTKGTSGWPKTPTMMLADPDGTKFDQFGTAVSVSGKTAFISAVDVPGPKVQDGAVYVFEKTSSGWGSRPAATLADPNQTEDDNFGYRLSLSRGTAAIARLAVGNGEAAAYIYSRGASNWPTKPTAALMDPSPSSNDQFGQALAASGNAVLVGAPGGNNGAGLAYMFKA